MKESAILEAPRLIPKNLRAKFDDKQINVGGKVIGASMVGRRDYIVWCRQIGLETARAEIDAGPTASRCSANLQGHAMGGFHILAS
jgi:hypothetical protein